MKPVKEPEALYGGTYTAKDYLTWAFDEMVELIKGKVWKMAPAPASNHQRVLRELAFQWQKALKGKQCEMFIAPFDVYLTQDPVNYQNASTVVQPDLCVICDEAKIKDFGCVGAPDLVVEILSPSTAKKDLNDKFQVYQEFGVKEYWVVHPMEKAVNVFVLENGVFSEAQLFSVEDHVQSAVFRDLQIPMHELFPF